MTNEPDTNDDSTERRAKNDSEGAASRRSVGSISSESRRLYSFDFSRVGFVSRLKLGDEGLNDPGSEDMLGEAAALPKVGACVAVGVSGAAGPPVVILDWLAFEKGPVIDVGVREAD